MRRRTMKKIILGIFMFSIAVGMTACNDSQVFCDRVDGGYFGSSVHAEYKCDDGTRFTEICCVACDNSWLTKSQIRENCPSSKRIKRESKIISHIKKFFH